MKKIFLVSVIALGAFTINAQSTSKKETKTEKGDKDEKKQLSPEERAKKQTSRMDAKLSFNSSQKEKVYAINLSKNILVDNAHTTYMNDKKTFQQEKKKINKERMQEVRGVFTKEQHKAWKELKKESKEKKGGQKLSPAGGTAATDDELDEEIFNQFIKE